MQPRTSTASWPRSNPAVDAGKDEKSLSGGAGGEAPAGFPILGPHGVPIRLEVTVAERQKVDGGTIGR
jgi:hypothetical protein